MLFSVSIHRQKLPSLNKQAPASPCLPCFQRLGDWFAVPPRCRPFRASRIRFCDAIFVFNARSRSSNRAAARFATATRRFLFTRRRGTSSADDDPLIMQALVNAHFNDRRFLFAMLRNNNSNNNDHNIDYDP